MSETTRERTVGFIGLGMMGVHMAANLVRKGHPLVVCDTVSEKCGHAAHEGAEVADSPRDVAERCRIIILMVADAVQVEDVLFGSHGVSETARSGDIVICMSTIGPAQVRSFASRLSARGVGLIDSPVVGMEQGAREGTLQAYVGGGTADFEACRHLLEAMATTVVHIGPVGQGLAMKLVNNLMIQVGWVAVSEALVMGAKAGIDPKQMVELIGKGTGNSVAFQYLGPRWLARDFDGVRLDIIHKDMQHELDLGKSVGVPMPMASIAQQIYEMARCTGRGSEDAVAVVKVYEDLAGLTLS